MKISKEQLTNAGFVIVLALILFTPLGFHARVFVSKIVAFSPSVLDADEQVVLPNYNWKLTSLADQSYNFETAKGKVILINFWATWCPPCVAEMPVLQELYDDYGEKVEFVFVAHDEQEKVSSFLAKKGYNFPVYFENTKTPNLLSSTSIPTTYIIDTTGKIVVEKTGAANWNSATTRELLDTLIAKRQP